MRPEATASGRFPLVKQGGWWYNILIRFFTKGGRFVPDFEVVSPYEPSGDHPAAIDTLVQGL